MKILLAFLCLFTSLNAHTFHYYATVSDAYHYPLLVNLIGSIHKNDFEHLDEIAVFDIGLQPEQRQTLEQIAKVKVFSVEQRNPDILTYFVTSDWGKSVRGWYTWKPVLMKQCLDMYPYFLFLDAGSLVLNSTDQLFCHIEQNGYFFIDVNHNIVDRMTIIVKDFFVAKLNEDQQSIVMNPTTKMIAGGVQGISRLIYFDYVFPLYLAAGNCDFFKDDGTATLGFGAGRHDQTLMSILARGKGFKSINSEGWSKLRVNQQDVPFHYHWDAHQVLPETTIYSCRWNYSHSKDMPSHIRWK